MTSLTRCYNIECSEPSRQIITPGKGRLEEGGGGMSHRTQSTLASCTDEQENQLPLKATKGNGREIVRDREIQTDLREHASEGGMERACISGH